MSFVKSRPDNIALTIKCIIESGIKGDIKRNTLDLIFEDMATTNEKSKQVIKILLGIILDRNENETDSHKEVEKPSTIESARVQDLEEFSNSYENETEDMSEGVTPENLIENSADKETKNILNKTVFKCNACEKEFQFKSFLIRHEVIHTNMKPFQCDTCGKSFHDKYNLRKHMITHTKNRPFECNTCSKCFASSKDLEQHEMIHTGELPFECNFCMKRFNRKNNLHIHQKSHKTDK